MILSIAGSITIYKPQGKTPSMWDLIHLADDILNWYKLGLELKLPSTDLQQIRAAYRGEGINPIVHMFMKWLVTDKDASWQTLISALKKSDHQELAASLTTKYGSGKSIDFFFNISIQYSYH